MNEGTGQPGLGETEKHRRDRTLRSVLGLRRTKFAETMDGGKRINNCVMGRTLCLTKETS